MVPMPSFYRYLQGSFPGRGGFLAFLKHSDTESIIHMGSLMALQHHIPNRTGFASQSYF